MYFRPSDIFFPKFFPKRHKSVAILTNLILERMISNVKLYRAELILRSSFNVIDSAAINQKHMINSELKRKKAVMGAQVTRKKPRQETRFLPDCQFANLILSCHWHIIIPL